jgi:hypothetical protein
MELEQALARIVELEGRVTALTGERDTLTGERDVLSGERDALAADRDARIGERDVAHGRELTNLRRALLAEHAGQVVPELVSGDDEAALLASVEVAKQAYRRALEAARTTIASQTVPAGAPSARTAPAAGLSPLEMIESGLRR